jgi:hypothetical protein
VTLHTLLVAVLQICLYMRCLGLRGVQLNTCAGAAEVSWLARCQLDQGADDNDPDFSEVMVAIQRPANKRVLHVLWLLAALRPMGAARCMRRLLICVMQAVTIIVTHVLWLTLPKSV